LGVVAARGVVGIRPLVREVASVLEVGDALVEAPSFEAVMDGDELLVFALDFCNDGVSVRFELSAPLVVSLVSFHLCRGCDVEVADRRSHSEERGSCGLEELLAPIGHGVNVPS
jgi:hypothetical protein